MIDWTGVDAKLSRAKRHAADFEEMTRAVIQSKAQVFVLENDGEPGKRVLKVYGVPTVPDEWSVVAGDCLFNLRSSLDHMAWQLVELDGGAPNDKTQFPILYKPPSKAGVRQPIRLGNHAIRRQDIRQAVESVQRARAGTSEGTASPF